MPENQYNYVFSRPCYKFADRGHCHKSSYHWDGACNNNKGACAWAAKLGRQKEDAGGYYNGYSRKWSLICKIAAGGTKSKVTGQAALPYPDPDDCKRDAPNDEHQGVTRKHGSTCRSKAAVSCGCPQSRPTVSTDCTVSFGSSGKTFPTISCE